MNNVLCIGRKASCLTAGYVLVIIRTLAQLVFSEAYRRASRSLAMGDRQSWRNNGEMKESGSVTRDTQLLKERDLVNDIMAVAI